MVNSDARKRNKFHRVCLGYVHRVKHLVIQNLQLGHSKTVNDNVRTNLNNWPICTTRFSLIDYTETQLL